MFTKSTAIVVVFAILNAALYLHSDAVPLRDVFASITAFALVVITADSRIHRQVNFVKSNDFKKYFPIVSVSELITFLIVPWVLLIIFRGTDSWQSVISPHLYSIQTQVGLEQILVSRKRHGASFRFIVASNIYRGIALATGISRYMAIRNELIASSARMVMFMNIYTALSVLVYIMSNCAIAFLWYPLLEKGDDLTAGGLRTYKGSVCIITGAGSGIGRELAVEIGERGAQAVILMDMQLELAEEVASMLRSKGIDSTVHNVDVRDFAQVQLVVNETWNKYKRLDYLFNNAGILIIGPIEKIGVENFDYILDVNVRGVHHGVQAVLPVMKNQGFGHIVNVSSLLGLIPGGQWAVAYSASKHAVVGLSTNLRIEAAKYGVRVSCFCPGTIQTPIHSGGKYGKNLTDIPEKAWNAQLAKMKAMDAKTCAIKALDHIANNKALFVVPNKPMLMSRVFYRLSPSLWLYNKINRVDWRRKLTKPTKKAE